MCSKCTMIVMFLYTAGCFFTDVSSASVGRAESYRVEVFQKAEEAWAYPDTTANLFCGYNLSPNSDVPVTITWKVGDGPRFATDLLKCTGYTTGQGKCATLSVLDSHYIGRVMVGSTSPSLEISKVTVLDNRNYWCQVTVENPSNAELEMDMKSIVLRVYNGGEMPKFHSVKIDSDLSEAIGGNVTIGCVCDNGYHCDDVAWYKGPTDSAASEYDLVYTRTSFSRPVPTEYKAHGDWVDRAYLQGDSLVVTDLRVSDAGRYWCELRSIGYYGIGEWATDSKSVILDIAPVERKSSFSCYGKPDGLYPDNCNQYYECAKSKLRKRRCPRGTVFDTHGTCSSLSEARGPCGGNGGE